jgi:hypothetical protein
MSSQRSGNCLVKNIAAWEDTDQLAAAQRGAPEMKATATRHPALPA